MANYEKIIVTYDEDEYMYQKIGESKEMFEERMQVLDKRLDARVPEDAKERVSELLKLAGV